MGTEAAGGLEEPAGLARCGLGSADQQRYVVPRDRPRPSLALRHSTTGCRYRSLRCLRTTPGCPVLYASQQLSRGTGDHPFAAERPGFVEEAISEIALDASDAAALRDDQVRHASCDLLVDKSPGAVSGGYLVF